VCKFRSLEEAFSLSRAGRLCDSETGELSLDLLLSDEEELEGVSVEEGETKDGGGEGERSEDTAILINSTGLSGSSMLVIYQHLFR